MILKEWHDKPTTEIQKLLQTYQARQLEWIEKYNQLDKELVGSPRRQAILDEKDQEIGELGMLISGLKLILALRDSDTMQSSPPTLPPLSEAEIVSLLEKGQGHREDRDIHLAIETFNTILRHHPQHVQALFERGLSFILPQEYERAIADFSAVIALAPDHLQAYRERSDAHDRLRHWPEVVADETKILELTPDDPIAYSNRGLAHELLKQYPEALADLSRAIELDPTDSSAYASRADVYTALGDYQQALADCEQARLHDPNWKGIPYRIEKIHRLMASQSKS